MGRNCDEVADIERRDRNRSLRIYEIMENVISTEKEGVKILLEGLVAKGIKHVILSPGSRNAPLLMAVVREKRMEHYVVVDERSAAFFALGMVQRLGEPVAVVCTSGSALLNYAPAVSEAYYQRLPLVVVSADRPVAWVDQNDSQTIRQRGVLQNIVKASFEVAGEIRNEEERWYAVRTVNDAIECAMKGCRGPVHINVPLREPLYGLRKWDKDIPVRSIERIEGGNVIAPEVMATLSWRIENCQKVMILAGCHLPDRKMQEALARLGELENVVILSETPANTGNGKQIGMIDRVLATVSEQERMEYAPELLVTFGGPLISRHVKAFLRKYRPQEHWCIDRSSHLVDTFQVLTKQVNMEAESFLEALSRQVKKCSSDYAARWQVKKELSSVRHEQFAQEVGWCDWKAFSILLPTIPQGTALQLSNSTPVRYGQLFDCRQFERVDANRGTSGIDGATSTAVGAALLNLGMTLLITGDISFLYDSNALWNRYITPRFKMVVMKNGGGGIFRFIQGPSELEELEECFETRQEVNIRGYADLYHFAFFRAECAEELQQVLSDFWAESERPAILEVDTTMCDNAAQLKAYFRKLSGE